MSRNPKIRIDHLLLEIVLDRPGDLHGRILQMLVRRIALTQLLGISYREMTCPNIPIWKRSVRLDQLIKVLEIMARELERSLVHIQDGGIDPLPVARAGSLDIIQFHQLAVRYLERFAAEGTPDQIRKAVLEDFLTRGKSRFRKTLRSPLSGERTDLEILQRMTPGA